jgi:hypothetical protein
MSIDGLEHLVEEIKRLRVMLAVIRENAGYMYEPEEAEQIVGVDEFIDRELAKIEEWKRS